MEIEDEENKASNGEPSNAKGNGEPSNAKGKSEASNAKGEGVGGGRSWEFPFGLPGWPGGCDLTFRQCCLILIYFIIPISCLTLLVFAGEVGTIVRFHHVPEFDLDFEPLPNRREDCPICVSGKGVTMEFGLNYTGRKPPNGTGVILFGSSEGPFSSESWFVIGFNPPNSSFLVEGETLLIEDNRNCVGVGGSPLYVVACVPPDGELGSYNRGADALGPPFNDRCVAIGSVCGVPCGGFHLDLPQDLCEDGVIPFERLVEEEEVGDGSLQIRQVGSWLQILLIVTSFITMRVQLFNSSFSLYYQNPQDRRQIENLPDDVELSDLKDKMGSHFHLVVATTAYVGENLACLFRTVVLNFCNLHIEVPRGAFDYYVVIDIPDPKMENGLKVAKEMEIFLLHVFRRLEELKEEWDWEVTQGKLRAIVEDTCLEIPQGGVEAIWEEFKKKAVSIGAEDLYLDLREGISGDSISLPSKGKEKEEEGEEKGSSFTMFKETTSFHVVRREEGGRSKAHSLNHVLKWLANEKEQDLGKVIFAILDARHASSENHFKEGVKGFFQEVSGGYVWKEKLRFRQHRHIFKQLEKSHRYYDTMNRAGGSFFLGDCIRRSNAGLSPCCGTGSFWRMKVNYHTWSKMDVGTLVEDLHESIRAWLRGEYSTYYHQKHLTSAVVKAGSSQLSAYLRWSKGGWQQMRQFPKSVLGVFVIGVLYVGLFSVLAIDPFGKFDNKLIPIAIGAFVSLVEVFVYIFVRDAHVHTAIFLNSFIGFHALLTNIFYIFLLPSLLMYQAYENESLDSLVNIVAVVMAMATVSLLTFLFEVWEPTKTLSWDYWHSFLYWLVSPITVLLSIGVQWGQKDEKRIKAFIFLLGVFGLLQAVLVGFWVVIFLLDGFDKLGITGFGVVLGNLFYMAGFIELFAYYMDWKSGESLIAKLPVFKLLFILLTFLFLFGLDHHLWDQLGSLL